MWARRDTASGPPAIGRTHRREDRGAPTDLPLHEGSAGRAGRTGRAKRPEPEAGWSSILLSVTSVFMSVTGCGQGGPSTVTDGGV